MDRCICLTGDRSILLRRSCSKDRSNPGVYCDTQQETVASCSGDLALLEQSRRAYMRGSLQVPCSIPPSARLPRRGHPETPCPGSHSAQCTAPALGSWAHHAAADALVVTQMTLVPTRTKQPLHQYQPWAVGHITQQQTLLW